MYVEYSTCARVPDLHCSIVPEQQQQQQQCMGALAFIPCSIEQTRRDETRWPAEKRKSSK